MSTAGTGTPAAQVAAPKKTAAKAKKPRTKPKHPPTSEMVNAAIQNLKERGGSSLQAIKKYISVTYDVDAEKQASFIRKYLKFAVTSGTLVQTKGKGAAGSFKLSVKSEGRAKPKAKVVKPASPKKKPAVKKPAAPKKPVTKKAAPKKAATGEKRKASKGPAAKPPKAKSAAKPKAAKAASPAKKVTKAKKPAAKKAPAKK